VVLKVVGNDNFACFQYLELYCAVVDELHHEGYIDPNSSGILLMKNLWDFVC